MTTSTSVEKRSVIAVIFNHQRDHILLIKRRDVPIWVLPGGGIDQGESPEEAVIREIREETGLNATIKRQVAFYTPINRLAHPTYFFECEPVDGTLSTGDETRELDFFPLTSLPSPFFFIHKDWVADAQKLLPVVIHQPLKQVTYFRVFCYFCQHPLQVLRFILSRLGIPINS